MSKSIILIFASFCILAATADKPAAWPIFEVALKSQDRVDSVLEAYNPANCPIDKFTMCTYNSMVSMGMVIAPTTMSQWVNDVFYFAYQSASNYRKNCQIFKQFYSCLGESASTCLSTDFEIHYWGWSYADAYTLAEVLARFNYTCSRRALPVILRNFGCIQQTYVNDYQQLNQCAMTYSNQMNTTYANHCEYNAEFAQCYSQYFQSCGMRVANVECRALSAQFNSVMPDCNPHKYCRNNSNSTSSGDGQE